MELGVEVRSEIVVNKLFYIIAVPHIRVPVFALGASYNVVFRTIKFKMATL